MKSIVHQNHGIWHRWAIFLRFSDYWGQFTIDLFTRRLHLLKRVSIISKCHLKFQNKSVEDTWHIFVSHEYIKWYFNYQKAVFGNDCKLCVLFLLETMSNLKQSLLYRNNIKSGMPIRVFRFLPCTRAFLIHIPSIGFLRK